MGCVDPIAVRLERHPRRIEGLHRPAQIPRSQRDLGLGDHTPRPGHRFFRPKSPRRAFHQRPGPHQIAELRHRDAPKGERRRVVTQRHPVQRPKRITRRQRTRRRGDQGIHVLCAIAVTPDERYPGFGLIHGVKHSPVRATRFLLSRYQPVHKIRARQRSTVGAGLPAKAVGQLASMLNVLPPSLASQLLQGACGAHRIRA
ncbi:hypothetical protein D3C87_1467380 [compost metagenome]